MSTFANRLKAAREHASKVAGSELSQAQLARDVGLKPQGIQYLEEEQNKARGSKYTGAIARRCGVDPSWLESGQGNMVPTEIHEPRAKYDTNGGLGAAIAELPADLRDAFSKIIVALASSRKTTRKQIPYSEPPGREAELRNVRKRTNKGPRRLTSP